MENVTKKEADGIGQPCECREDETKKFNVFIQEMVQVVEKYGKQVLRTSEYSNAIVHAFQKFRAETVSSFV